MTDPSVAALHRGLLGPSHTKPQSPQFPNPVPITVLDGGSPEGVRFTVDGLDSSWAFGPAPFPRPVQGQVPPGGTKGVAVFAPNSETAWIVALFDWP
ncbi:hypothetical protein LQ327_09040 [Actinomycetospora endophytica]|uniref:Uncharacterized protein n=1 Tax=Actinomycetospora endophytica TaxID=2291215 RepID=A0ABS8P5J3_9PSEU|nr:hypothetical protein [Actinomycetospora endophytica]MCD2193527.1 hypothetical protein [Actinomycetospora endophytica]